MIQTVFVYCVKFADYFQFIDLSIIAIDGSKIRVNASKYKILKMEDIPFLQYMFKKEEIQNYIEQIEKASTKKSVGGYCLSLNIFHFLILLKFVLC